MLSDFNKISGNIKTEERRKLQRKRGKSKSKEMRKRIKEGVSEVCRPPLLSPFSFCFTRSSEGILSNETYTHREQQQQKAAKLREREFEAGGESRLQVFY